MGVSCDECGKTFGRKDTLKRHKDSAHEVSVFACLFCDKRFSRKDSLLKHSLKHLSGPVYECTLCTQKFNRKDNFERHKRIVHKLKWVLCLFCYVWFNMNINSSILNQSTEQLNENKTLLSTPFSFQKIVCEGQHTFFPGIWSNIISSFLVLWDPPVSQNKSFRSNVWTNLSTYNYICHWKTSTLK